MGVRHRELAARRRAVPSREHPDARRPGACSATSSLRDGGERRAVAAAAARPHERAAQRPRAAARRRRPDRGARRRADARADDAALRAGDGRRLPRGAARQGRDGRRRCAALPRAMRGLARRAAAAAGRTRRSTSSAPAATARAASTSRPARRCSSRPGRARSSSTATARSRAAPAAPTCSRRSACRCRSTSARRGACLAATGFTFLFAPHYHPAMKAVAPVRRALAVRTVFNLLGPLTNPAAPPFSLIGAYSRGRRGGSWRRRSPACRSSAHSSCTASRAGTRRRRSVRSSCYDVRPGRVSSVGARSARLGLARCAPAELAGGDAAHNAARPARGVRGRATAARTATRCC